MGQDRGNLRVLTIIVELQFGVSSDDGRKKAGRSLVGLPVWHVCGFGGSINS